MFAQIGNRFVRVEEVGSFSFEVREGEPYCEVAIDGALVVLTGTGAEQAWDEAHALRLIGRPQTQGQLSGLAASLGVPVGVGCSPWASERAAQEKQARKERSASEARASAAILDALRARDVPDASRSEIAYHVRHIVDRLSSTIAEALDKGQTFQVADERIEGGGFRLTVTLK